MIYVLRSQATSEQIQEMLRPLQTYIKLAVDVRREIVAGGGAMHSDCESLLLYLKMEAGKKIFGAQIGIQPHKKLHSSH